MQVNLHKKSIDQHLSNALEKGGTNGSVFKWYLATQVNDVTSYHPKKWDESEGLLPYPSINLPTAPKASFYAQDTDYKESCQQQEKLSNYKHPAIPIHFMNCLKPQCLHYLRQEQLISHEIIDNSPLHIQQMYGKKPLPSYNSNEDLDINSTNINYETCANQKMPSNMFVDSTLENMAKSADMTF